MSLIRVSVSTIALVVAFSLQLHSATYYVSDDPDTAGLSTNPNSPGEISHAFANASSGSTVYVEKGFYLFKSLTVGHDDVSFIGVTDLVAKQPPSTAAPTGEAEILTTQGQEYPVLYGSSSQRQNGAAITANRKDGLRIENFYIYNYKTGIAVLGKGSANQSDASLIENCIAKDLGYPKSDNDYYSGKGILLSNNPHGSVDGCYVENAGAEGIYLRGRDMAIRNSRVVGRDSEPGTSASAWYNGTDYYFGMNQHAEYNGTHHIPERTVECTGNVIEDCVAERIFEGGHSGKGFCISSTSNGLNYPSGTAHIHAYDNLVQRVIAVNLGSSLTARYEYCHDNKFFDCDVIDGVALRLVNGPDDNLFDRIRQINGAHAILLAGDKEMEGNDVTNSAFHCWRIFSNYNSSLTSDFRDSKIINSTFVGLTGNAAMNQLRGMSLVNVDMTNCIIADFDHIEIAGDGGPMDLNIRSTCIYNNGFDSLDLSGSATFFPSYPVIELDPQFVDAANNDYSLLSSSPCIDTGGNLFAIYNAQVGVQVVFAGDVYGGTRLHNGAIDIGGDEFTP